MGLIDDLDSRRETADRHRENSARLAQAYCVFKTKGEGTHQFEERVPFGLTFTEKPLVSYGSACDLDDMADAMDVEDTDDVQLPNSSGFVVQWDQDERGFYTGCWVAVRVKFEEIFSARAIGGNRPPEIEHHFTFAAIGMKDIPPDLTN